MEIKDILYIHGITAYGNNHHSLEKQLNKMGYTFHHPDLPGHGIQASTETNNQYTFDDMLLFLKTYIKINIRDKPFIIMGHSMGGGLTLALYKNFKKQITRVILECPLTPAIFNQSERFSKIKFKDFLINISKYKKFIKDN
jgi:alpha-beta hydrolase superfamily lysophospholipase